MRNQTEKNACVAVIGSMTRTMRAQSVLASAAIRAQIIKADSLQGKHGCVYALSYPCSQAGNVKRILSDAGVKVRAYQGEHRDLS